MDWREIPSLAALRAFEAAARLESLSAAARTLNVTHAAIAQHVRMLEDHFGAPLLEREGRGMRATPEGQALARALSDGFGTIAAGVRDLADRAAVRPLRVAMTPSFAANWLMPRIGDFWRQYPDIRLDMVPDNRLVDLRADGFDMAIRYGRGGWPGVTATRLVAARHAIIAAPDLVARMGPPTVETLQAQHWILDKARQEERMWVKSLGIDLDAARISEIDTSILALQAVVAGHGLSIFPSATAAREVEQGRLTILKQAEDSDLGFYVLTRPDRTGPSVTAFATWLQRAV